MEQHVKQTSIDRVVAIVQVINLKHRSIFGRSIDTLVKQLFKVIFREKARVYYSLATSATIRDLSELFLD
jgi:hypothetical protein